MTATRQALVVLSLLTAPASARPPNADFSGIFSNVMMSPETGDLGGLEIEIHAEAPLPNASRLERRPSRLGLEVARMADKR